MKKLILLITVLTLVFATQVGVFAVDYITVNVNGENVKFDTKPFIDENNRTLIPVRFVTEKLGAQVGWDGDTRTVTVDLDDKKVVLKIDQKGNYSVVSSKR